MAQLAQPKSTAFSEEDVCIISKAAPCAIWAGSKILYSGLWLSGPNNVTQASGYNFLSGESDVSPVSLSGWGQIRVPELNQLHKVFVFPKNPGIWAADNYTTLTVGTTSGYPTGHGGCSGKIAMVQYVGVCQESGVPGTYSGGLTFPSGYWNSGIVDIVAFGSQM